MISPSPVDLIRGYSAPVFLFSSSSLCFFLLACPSGLFCFLLEGSACECALQGAFYHRHCPGITDVMETKSDVHSWCKSEFKHIWAYLSYNREFKAAVHICPQCLNDISACVCVCVCVLVQGFFLASIKQCCVSVCLHWDWQTALTLNTLCCSNSPQLSCHLHTHISVCWHTVAHFSGCASCVVCFHWCVCVCVRAGLCFHCSNELFHTLNPQFFWHAVQIKTLHCSVFQNKFSVVIPYIHIHAHVLFLHFWAVSFSYPSSSSFSNHSVFVLSLSFWRVYLLELKLSSFTLCSLSKFSHVYVFKLFLWWTTNESDGLRAQMKIAAESKMFSAPEET